MENEYLQQVMQEKEVVERHLKRKRRMPGAAAAGSPDAPAVDVRIMGWWRFKTVVVPPNAHVVHTRRGHAEPLHCGMGISFRYNPLLDAFLAVPAAMQTIIVNARCVSRERQGILVQGYVQWIIDDFAQAYRKLDFSDPADPMGVVNVQLREQAEAAIKDTVATMSIDQILSDKQPIIEELTARLRQLTEGGKAESGGSAGGLGLRIVTIQIKEAVVSSTRLWDSLQLAFRAERTKEARLAELTCQGEVREKEAEAEVRAATLEIEKEQAVVQRRADARAAAFDAEQREKARRAAAEAETLERMFEHQKLTSARNAELQRQQLELENRAEELRLRGVRQGEEQQIELARQRREVDNAVSENLLRANLIERLPEIIERLPAPAELKSIQIGGLDALSSTVRGLLDSLETLRSTRSTRSS